MLEIHNEVLLAVVQADKENTVGVAVVVDVFLVALSIWATPVSGCSSSFSERAGFLGAAFCGLAIVMVVAVEEWTH